jgi:hypothetical protein
MEGKFATFAAFAVALPAFAQAGDIGNGVMPPALRDNAANVKSSKPLAPQAAPESSSPASARPIDQMALMQRYGNVLDRRPVGAGNLTAWTVVKNGRTVILYTTGDGQAIISGVVWESATGRNLSDQFVTGVPNVKPPLGGSVAAVNAPAPTAMSAALVGKYSGSIPESIKTIDSLAGVKEGNGGQADTLYVIFDPRCPYCRKAYSETREYIKRGFTIKWIPTVALGNPAQGLPLAATVLQAKPGQQAEALRRVLGNHEEIPSTPTKATEEALSRNLDFFFAAFKNNGVEQAGVPAAFFLDKRTGKPRMMTGISEPAVIEAIFGKR